MKLSQQVVIGLKRLGNQTLVADDCFKSLLKSAYIILNEHPKLSELNLNELCASKPDIVKESFASLLILLVESSRHNLDASALMSTMENYNLNLARLERITDLYEAHKANFQFSLKNIGTNTAYPKVTDVKWRLDFCIKSSSLEHESREVYFINIFAEQVRRKSLTEEITYVKNFIFTCSLPQLQELVAKLKDATKCIQAVAYPK